MTSRDTYDIEKYNEEIGQKQQILSHNIQIGHVAGMIAESEPVLFGNSDAKLMPVKKNEPSEEAKLIAARILQCVEWHAEQQIMFWNDLFAEESVL